MIRLSFTFGVTKLYVHNSTKYIAEISFFGVLM